MNNKQNLLDKEKTTKQNRVWVRIASACNVKCTFCLDSDAQNGTFPDPEQVKKEIRDGWKEGYENRIIISWWEASINPKFVQYIAYAKEVWYDRVQTVTNGNMFARYEFCKKLLDAGLEEITFSMHGHTANLHDTLVGAPGSFKKALKGLINIKKFFPHIIVNIDIVVCKVNVKFLPDIIKFYMRLWIYEYDLLQIIPFWRGFKEYKSRLFYQTEDYKKELLETWKLSRVPGMYMWTNRFPAESFEGYEDLIQDPRKFKSETMWEGYKMFEKFILSDGKQKPNCFGDACDVCFQEQYCHDYINTIKTTKIDTSVENYILQGQQFPSEVYEKFWETRNDFKAYLDEKKSQWKELINVPKCLEGSGIFQTYNDIKKENTLWDYTFRYIDTLYRKKSLRCSSCKYSKSCEWIHINFIRSYGFKILTPIQ